jgi:hypothetical protein
MSQLRHDGAELGEGNAVGTATINAFMAAASFAAIAIAGPAFAQYQGQPPRLTGDPMEAIALLATPAYVDRLASIETTVSPREAARQHDLLSAAINNLAPPRDGVTDVYVLAAGLDSDRVFGNEAREASEILARRYGAKTRTILLANGLGAGTVPSASPQHLVTALGAIGARMKPDEDVFILFITAHGGQGSGAVFKDQGRLTSILSPNALAALLRDAGIQDRLIIVSACFSGAFITPLADPRTAIVTAASADRTSFGCAPERDWTYFGDAFFSRALAKGIGLKAAFKEAQTTILSWEKRDNVLSSDPQIKVGRLADFWLSKLEAGVVQ